MAKYVQGSELEGRTIRKVVASPDRIAVLFADGDYTRVEAVPGDCDEADVRFREPQGFDLFCLGAITRDEYQARLAAEKDRAQEWRRRQYEALKREFEAQAPAAPVAPAARGVAQ